MTEESSQIEMPARHSTLFAQPSMSSVIGVCTASRTTQDPANQIVREIDMLSIQGSSWAVETIYKLLLSITSQDSPRRPTSSTTMLG